MGFSKQVIRKGVGAKASTSDIISLHCTGYGKYGDLSLKFWSIKDFGEKPLIFKIGDNKVMKAWEEAVLGAQVGEVARIHCSSDLAYGSLGSPYYGVLPYSPLCFDLEILKIDSSKNINEIHDNLSQNESRLVENLFDDNDKEGEPRILEAICEVENDASLIDSLPKNSDILDLEDKRDNTPVAGMSFETSDEAFNFYNSYASKMGFGIYKRDSRKRECDGKAISFRFSCSRNGKVRRKNEVANERARPTPKIKCNAQITVRYKDGLFYITKVVLDHNHKMLSPEKVRYLRCNKKIGAHVQKVLVYNDKAGVPPNLSYQSLVSRAGGYKNLTFTQKDCRNFIEKARRLRLGEGDAQALLLYFSRQQRNNTNFFYRIDLDEEGRLRNVFWADARSRLAYHYFHDIVTFDTTYLTNKYHMPFSPFVGVNHHGQSVILGAGLLSDETADTYEWLFQTWLECMGGCAPKAILTDQCQAIGNAISQIFPETRHRLCNWHIMKKVGDKLRAYDRNDEIRVALKRVVYESITIQEFESNWEKMIEDFQLQQNSWLRGLFGEKERWAPVYLNNTFWAGMTSTQRSEDMNSYFDKYVTSTSTLKQFIQQYEVAIKAKFEKEREEDYYSNYHAPALLSRMKLEEQLSNVYTINIFKKFQEEVQCLLECNATLLKENGEMTIFEVEDDSSGRTKRYEVLFNSVTLEVQCICCRFESMAILCRHCLKVFQVKKVQEIPSKYIVDRWKKDFKRLYSVSEQSLVVAENLMDRFDDLQVICQSKIMEIVEMAATNSKSYQFVVDSLSKISDTLKLNNLHECSTLQEGSSLITTTFLENDSSLGTSNYKILSPKHVKGPGRPRSKRLKGVVEQKILQKKRRASKSLLVPTLTGPLFSQASLCCNGVEMQNNVTR